MKTLSSFAAYMPSLLQRHPTLLLLGCLAACAPAPQIAMLGVCMGPRKGASATPLGDDPYAELMLQALPLYALPSDNVIMTCAAASRVTGRVFLGGADGHLYELQYGARDTWRGRRCAKVRAE